MTQNSLIVETSPVMTLAQQSEASRALQGGGSDPSPHQLLHFAIERNLPVESLERIVALAERMQDRSAAKAFAQSMRTFQSKVRSIAHNKKAKISTQGGGSFSYTYASLDEMAEVIREPLEECGLSYRWNTKLDDKGMLSVDCIVSHEAGHSESTNFTLPVASDNKAMSQQQKASAASKFARRLSLEAALGLTTTGEEREADQVDPATITAEQADEIEDLLINATDGKTPEEAADFRRRFLGYVEAESVAGILAGQYQKAVKVLTPSKRKS